MRVKILQSRVGVTETFNGGSEYDVSADRAERWIAAGFAEAVGAAPAKRPQPTAEPEAAVETADADPVIETAARTSRKKK